MGEVLSICFLPPSPSSFTRAQRGFPFLLHVLSLLPHHLTAVSRMFTLWGDLAPEEERDGRSIPYRDKMENELMETENRIEFMAPACWGCLQVIGISGSGEHISFCRVGGGPLVLMAQERGSVSLIYPCGPSHSLPIWLENKDSWSGTLEAAHLPAPHGRCGLAASLSAPWWPCSGFSGYSPSLLSHW